VNQKEICLKNKILEIRTGSHLYGLNTENSDMDYSGIFLPSKEMIFGFSNCEEIDLSIVDKLSNSKNSREAIDRKFYEFRKYVKLSLENNPNILETLFVNKENIIFINEYGKRLLDIAHLFPYEGLKNKFIGYASSQKKKMLIKRDNYLNLEDAEVLLEKIITEDNGKLLLPQCELKYKEFNNVFKLKKLTDNHYKVGDRSLVKNQTAKRALQEIRQIIGFTTNRKELIKAKGFDYKFGSHLIRLLIEGKELLETGRLEFPLKNSKDLLDIKLGKWDLKDVLDYSEEIESEINKLSNNLPKKPNYKQVEKFTIEMLEEWTFKENKSS